LLAHVLVSKYADHLPLYRLSQIFAREGVDIDRSTMADWVGRSTTLLEPLADAIGRIVRRGPALRPTNNLVLSKGSRLVVGRGGGAGAGPGAMSQTHCALV
jgi:hypothetical protein